MLDLAWSEIAIIGLVAVIVLGPKELPGAMRTMAKAMRKLRSLTSELQGHMNEIVREAELDEVRQSIQKLSSPNAIKEEIATALDPTGELQAQIKAPFDAVNDMSREPEPARSAAQTPAVHAAQNADEPKPAAPPSNPPAAS